MIVTVLDIVIAGLLMGGIYAIIAMGFSLQYGVARVLNVAHGDFIMIGGFSTWFLFTVFGISPLISLVICGLITFIIGYILSLTLFKRLRASSASPGDFEGNSLLVTFGLLFIIENAALILSGGQQVRTYSYLDFGVNLWGAIFAANRLVTLGFSIGISLAFFLFLARTRLGKAIRAAAQDTEAAGLMGVNINQVLALCFGLGTLMAGFAGVLVSMSYALSPMMGLEYTIIAIIVVVLGGMGSISGSFIGGFILGVVGSIVTHWEPSLVLTSYYFIFIILLLVRPAGIMGK